MRKTTVLLADDQELVREGVRSVLNTRDDFEVVAEASTGEEAFRLCIERCPDVALIEICNPSLDGLEVIGKVRERQTQTRFVVFSMDDRMYKMLEAVRAGASGYLLKRSSTDALLGAVDAVRAGDMYLEPAIATQITAALARQPSSRRSWSVLSKREVEVLKLAAEGNSTNEISRQIGLSPKTVNSHRSNLMKKLELHRVADLVRYAIREGIITA